MTTYGDIKSGEVALPAKASTQDANSIPALIIRAAQRLSEAKTSAEVLEAKAAAELALHYAKVTKAANESHADCLRIITRAEIRMAGEIDHGQERGEVAKAGRKVNVPASDNKATMAELGISRQRVNEWRKVAEVGEAKVEEAISGALADGRAPTKADIHRAAGIVKDKPKADEDLQVFELQTAWNGAGEGARGRFLIANNLTESNPATGTGGDDVDRSAERASSAVKVGATNSPDGATRRLDGIGPVQDGLKMSTNGQPSRGLSTRDAERPAHGGVTGGESAASEYQAQVTRQPEGERSTIGEAVASPAPRISETPATHPVPNGVQADRAPEVVPPTSGATPFQTLSKADQIRRLRPHCKHADDLENCGGRGKQHCRPCLKAVEEEGDAA